jgi:hypothetical protein
MVRNPRRLGRKKWDQMLTWLQGEVRRAKRVGGLTTEEYERKMDSLAEPLRSVLNVIEHRGNKGPARWVREH